MISVEARSIVLLCILSGGLAGCGTTNSWLATNVGDYMPRWAGGLPEDAPPRPGTPEYEEYKKKLDGDGNKPDPRTSRRPAHDVSSNRAY